MKIAVFGSAFNPPSLGHKDVIERLNHFDKILLVPSISHAWGKVMLPYKERAAMVLAFIDDLVVKNVELSLIEEQLYVPDQSVTTFSLLNKIQEMNQEADITFVIGPDNFMKFNDFYKSSEIMQRWSVMACPEIIQVRSTQIRDAIANNHSISNLTTQGVERFIKQYQLYK